MGGQRGKQSSRRPHDSEASVAVEIDRVETASSRALLKFNRNVERQSAKPTFAGTYHEYNDKVIQFGFVALFSAAWPLAALVYSLYNVLELRADAYKIVSKMRRPRYWGAQGIGDVATVLNVMSWLALPVNVLIVSWSSWVLRDQLFIPASSGYSQPCATTSVASAVTRHSAFYGGNVSIDAVCLETYLDCYAEVGGVDWLPANLYLKRDATVSVRYSDAVCEPSHPVYSEAECKQCKIRTGEVDNNAYLFILIVLVGMALIKVALVWLVPDKPFAIVQAEARHHHKQTVMAEAKAQTEQAKSHGVLEMARLLKVHEKPEDAVRNEAIR